MTIISDLYLGLIEAPILGSPLGYLYFICPMCRVNLRIIAPRV